MRSLRRSIGPFLILVVIVMLVGTAGYALIERWSLLDSLYMTAITLTTVGFGEVRPLSAGGRIFTIALIVLGVGTVAYGLSSVGEYLLTAGLGRRLHRRRVDRMIVRLKDHVIVCGYGRVGRSVVQTLLENKIDLVVIESDNQVVDELNEEGLAAVHGDATRDDMLARAGIQRARALMVCSGSDTDNLFVVLSARTLNPDLLIVARSVDPESEKKMRRAGADRVISPYQLGGRQMANVLVRPRVTEFFDVVTLDSGLELWLEEITIDDGSLLAGQTVVDVDLRRKTGVTLVAMVKTASGSTVTPDENTTLEAGDDLIVLGTREQLDNLAQLADGRPSSATRHDNEE